MSIYHRYIVTSVIELLILEQEKLYYAICVTNKGGRVRAQCGSGLKIHSLGGACSGHPIEVAYG